MNLETAKLMVESMTANDLHQLKSHVERTYSRKFDEEKSINSVRGVMEYVLAMYEMRKNNQEHYKTFEFSGWMPLSHAQPSYEMVAKEDSHVMRALKAMCEALKSADLKVWPEHSQYEPKNIIWMNFSARLAEKRYLSDTELLLVRAQIPLMVAELDIALRADMETALNTALERNAAAYRAQFA